MLVNQVWVIGEIGAFFGLWILNFRRVMRQYHASKVKVKLPHE